MNLDFSHGDGRLVTAFLVKYGFATEKTKLTIEPVIFDIIFEAGNYRSQDVVDKNFVYYGQIFGLPITGKTGLEFWSNDSLGVTPIDTFDILIPETNSANQGTPIVIDNFIFNDWDTGTYTVNGEYGRFHFKGWKITYEV